MANLPLSEMATGAAGVGLTQVFHWWANRGRTKAYTMGAVDHAVQTAMTLVTERLERVEGQHEACEVSLRDVNGRLDEAKREIDRLMAGRIAPAGEPDTAP